MNKFIYFITIIISISQFSYASEKFLINANLYTVKIRTSIDRPFIEDEILD